MSHKRTYHNFTYREAVFRICCERFDTVTAEIVRQRGILENYIEHHSDFQHSFEPVELMPDAPEIAKRMAHAGRLAGVGPMAAVAGAMAQCAAEAALNDGAAEAIIDNGGDIYLQTTEPVIIGIGTNAGQVTGQLGFSLQPEDTPISICSSSGKMGHSTSLGECDLAAVVSRDAALADAAATQAANLVKEIEDVESALNRIAAIEGIDGVLIIKDNQVGCAGALPPLVKIR